jgi:hypothetical protein
MLFPDELLLVECRHPPSKEPFTADSVRAPTIEEIRVATQALEAKNTLKLDAPLECSADVSESVIMYVCVSDEFFVYTVTRDSRD